MSPPLDEYLKILKIGAPEAHQLFFPVTEICLRTFYHKFQSWHCPWWPPVCRQPLAGGVKRAGQYLNFKDAPNFMKIGTQIVFWTRNTMEPLIFDENHFLIPKKRFLYFRPKKRMATCHCCWAGMGVNRLLLLRLITGPKSNLGDFPFLRS